MRLTESLDMPRYETFTQVLSMGFMGQELRNPPSVEGWDGGTAWIETGSLIERMNFAAEQLGNTTLLGQSNYLRKWFPRTMMKFHLRECLTYALTMLGLYQYMMTRDPSS
ncbi:MAG: hypothetical protein CM1200mP39_31140 [Dehalococcoidia bacterium]|nr:MAG: hypothetical protein CM1200mP39_31140 [Dehalococcoidia bacterium]